MRSPTELHRKIELALANDRLEEAAELIEMLAPISSDAMDRILAEAPIEDEQLGPGDFAAIAEGRRLRELARPRTEGSGRRAS